jgi:hypothetical protein
MTERKIVGFGGQLRILLWKNWILSKRNTCGLISEVILPIALIIFLILMRYLIDVLKYYDQVNPTASVINLAPLNTTGKTIFYYPDNVFIRNAVNNAVSVMQLDRPYNFTGNFILFRFGKLSIKFDRFFHSRSKHHQ